MSECRKLSAEDGNSGINCLRISLQELGILGKKTGDLAL